MKQQMHFQRFFASLLLLAVSIFSWARSVEIDGIYYDLEEQKATVAKNPAEYTGNITIPSSVRYEGVTYSVTGIGYRAFWGCSDLTSVTIPNSVKIIAFEAFSDCKSLTSVTIPSSVTGIGPNAFNSCSALTSIRVAPGNTKFDSRNNCNAIIEKATNKLIVGCKNTVIPYGVKSIGFSAFWGCKNLTSIKIPSSVTTIEMNAFGSCTGLTSVTIPNSVTSLAGFCFCTNLQSITIPSGVTSIGKYAFYKCTALTAITCYATKVPACEDYAFDEVSATLYVPQSSLNSYKASDPWGKIGQILPIK